MNKRSQRPRRLAAHDYTSPGAYFVTITTYRRQALFGELQRGALEPSPAGRMLIETWRQLPNRLPAVSLDVCQPMPDHIHFIVWIRDQPTGRKPISLEDVVHWFKTMTTNAYIRMVKEAGWPRYDRYLWQRGFYERVIRDEEELARLRVYTVENPLK